MVDEVDGHDLGWKLGEDVGLVQEARKYSVLARQVCDGGRWTDH
jgi:hypothetical protein